MRPSNPSVPNPKDLHSKTVGFASSPVASELRPPTHTEQWTLYYYEFHAQSCKACHSPSEPLQKHKQKQQQQQSNGIPTHCSTGRELALQVAALFYRHDGAIYSSASTPHRIVRVEIPSRYTHCRSLLKSVARAVQPACAPAQKHSERHSSSMKKSAHPVKIHHHHHHDPSSSSLLPPPPPPACFHHGGHAETKHKHKHGQAIVDWPEYSSARHAVAAPTAAHAHAHAHVHANDRENGRSREEKKKTTNSKSKSKSKSKSDDTYSTCAVVGTRGYSFANGAKPIGSVPATVKPQSYNIIKPHRGSLYLDDLTVAPHCADPCCRLVMREPAWDRRHSLWSTSYYT